MLGKHCAGKTQNVIQGHGQGRTEGQTDVDCDNVKASKTKITVQRRTALLAVC
jgi:hypothetical protein